MREAFEREMRAVQRYASMAMEPGTSLAEIQSLLQLARRRLADAGKVAATAPPGEERSAESSS